MLLIGIYEPFRKRKVLLTDETVAAEGVLSFVSPLSRLSGYPPYRILRKFTRVPVPVSSWNAARDQTRPWGLLKDASQLLLEYDVRMVYNYYITTSKGREL